jgi:hypothetical protein
MTVYYDYDPVADFTKLKTYSWLPIPAEPEVGGLIVNRLKMAVNRHLEQRGFDNVSEGADFLIAAHVGKKEKMDIVDLGYRYGPYGRYWERDIQTRYYEEGTFIMDFINNDSKEVIWRAVVKDILEPTPTPDEQNRRINEAVQKMLIHFPPNQSE